MREHWFEGSGKDREWKFKTTPDKADWPACATVHVCLGEEGEDLVGKEVVVTVKVSDHQKRPV